MSRRYSNYFSILIGLLFLPFFVGAQSDSENAICLNVAAEAESKVLYNGNKMTLAEALNAKIKELDSGAVEDKLVGCYIKKRGASGTGALPGDWGLDGCVNQYCQIYDTSKTGNVFNKYQYDVELCKRIVKNKLASKFFNLQGNAAGDKIAYYKFNNDASFGSPDEIFSSCRIKENTQGQYVKFGKKTTLLGGDFARPACCVAYPTSLSVPESCSAMRLPCANSSNDYQVKEFSSQGDEQKDKNCANISKALNSELKNAGSLAKVGEIVYDGSADRDIGALCAVKSKIVAGSAKAFIDERCKKLSETCCQFMVNQCSGKFGKDSAAFDENVFISDITKTRLYPTNEDNIRTAIYFRPTVGIPGTDFSTGALVKIDASTFGKFLGQFFGFALSIVAIMAILMIIIAGATMYFKAAKGDINGAAKAKDQIKGAILGLVFTLAAVTIFRFISPRLVEIPSLTTENIAVNKKDIFNYQEVFGSSYGGGTNGDVASIALKEFERWGNGTVKESDNKDNSELPGYAYIKKYYYPAGNCGNLDPTTTAGAWSSAFISFVMKTAGINSFPASCMHTGYFKKIKDSPGVCVANRMTDVDKIGIGNILCKNRSGSTSVTFDKVSGEAHCDIVTNRSGDSVDIVGGNRDIKGDGSTDGLTVAKSTVKISSVKNNAGYFGFIACTGSQSANNGGSQSGSQCSNNYISGVTNYNLKVDVSKQDEFKKILDKLQYQASPWPKEVVKSQAILESAWGQSDVAKNNSNYFGMKCGTYASCLNGYRKYNSIQESVNDYYSTLNGSNWSSALKYTKDQLAKNSIHIDYSKGCEAAWFGFKHKDVIWATDSNYSSKIVAILNSRFNANCPDSRSEYFKDATGTVDITKMANYTNCQL